ncbi:MAG: NAD-dependent epimerase/dehydratase family protein [Hellea sp.]|nr:NAD-dependent epimerase/dehydratase family protein [Hellea sp.]
MLILITGTAGFIGFHAAKRFLSLGYAVIGLDSLNDYYEVSLKNARLNQLECYEKFEFYKVDIADYEALVDITKDKEITYILHLAAQAGVRYSLEMPRSYIRSNVLGHLNILELARNTPAIKHIVYASSSSVYGDKSKSAFKETDIVNSPASLYAATKISGEMIAESYSKLYGINQTGLRFFTVYGPWGRPDMAYYIFTDKIFNKEPIELFSPEKMTRDFTYIDDIIDVLPRVLESTPSNLHAIYNLGNSNPNTLMQLVEAVETACEASTQKVILKKQNGDVSYTHADINAAKRDFGFAPRVELKDGIKNFVNWYKNY